MDHLKTLKKKVLHFVKYPYLFSCQELDEMIDTTPISDQWI